MVSPGCSSSKLTGSSNWPQARHVLLSVSTGVPQFPQKDGLRSRPESLAISPIVSQPEISDYKHTTRGDAAQDLVCLRCMVRMYLDLHKVDGKYKL